MKRTALVVTCIALLVALSASAGAQAVPKDIQAFYAKCAQAMQKRDGAALAKQFAPNIVSVDQKGRTTKGAAVAQEMSVALSMMTEVSAKFTIVSAVVKGDRATVVNDAVFGGKLKNPQTGKTMVLKTLQRCKDVLVKTAKGWLMEKTTTLKDTSTIDGKPVPGA